MSGWWTVAVTLIYVIMASPAAEADALGTAPINATLFNLQTMYNEVSTLGTIFLDVDVCVKGKSGLPLSDYIAWGASDDITHANWHMLKARMSAQGLQLLTVQPDNTRAVRHAPSGKNHTAFSDSVLPRDVQSKQVLATMAATPNQKNVVLLTRVYACGGAGGWYEHTFLLIRRRLLCLVPH